MKRDKMKAKGPLKAVLRDDGGLDSGVIKTKNRCLET